MMKTARLENWCVVGDSSPYTAPEAVVQKLQGEVYDHPCFIDGEPITSSALTFLKGGIAKTHNTRYRLGLPEPKYTAWCIMHGYNVWNGPKDR